MQSTAATRITLAYFGVCWLATVIWLVGLLLIAARQKRNEHMKGKVA